jgi:hypothetical protein
MTIDRQLESGATRDPLTREESGYIGETFIFEEVEAVAEAIWQAEWTRSGQQGPRKVKWEELSVDHQRNYRWLATAAIGKLETIRGARK